MVCAGDGIGIGSHGLEDDFVDSGRLIRLGTPVARNGFGYYLVYRKELLEKPSFERLRAYLLQSEHTGVFHDA